MDKSHETHFLAYKTLLWVYPFFLVLSGCGLSPSDTSNDPVNKGFQEVDFPNEARELITPLPQFQSYNESKAQLGKKLFNDPRLSKDNTISCSHCHRLDKGGADGSQFSIGVDGKLGHINAPTVFNTVNNFVQFWDGRAKDLKEQAKVHITNPNGMASSFKEIISKLSKDSDYQKAFKALYKDGITEDAVVNALAEFEKALVTPDSPFDRYLRGDKKALTQEEIRGFQLFKSKGCIACHNGVNVGGNMYQKLGVMQKYSDPSHNLGRYNVTKREEDKYYFKVPSLRNIDLTAPYFHNGLVATLNDAVQLMAYYQLGRVLKQEESDKIVLFLKTLTGETPAILGKNP
ncbi:MAG: cytochrome b6 [bacterium]|nr:MAG: cytochrome b6 [bacterium]